MPDVDVYGLDVSGLFEGDAPLQVVVVVKVLDSDGEVSYRMTTSDMPLVDCLGPLTWAQANVLHETVASTTDGDEL